MVNKIVVTGIGAITPLGLNAIDSWNSIKNGNLGISEITTFDSSDLPIHIAAEVKNFNPEETLGRKDAKRLDRFSQFACVAALEAIENAGIDLDNIDRTRFASVVGSGVGGILTLSEQFNVLLDKGATKVSPFLIPMMLPDMAAGRVSMKLGAKGINFSPVTACASGTDAIGQAAELIKKGSIDIAIAGGAEAAICPIALAGFNSCKALSNNEDPNTASRPFDLNRDGFILGEGAGLILLENFEHARLRNANIIAELVGYGASSDAFHITQPSPKGEGAARAMNLALQDAKIEAGKIDYINAHGTSTPLNDKFETMSIKTVFPDNAKNIPVSSTKSMTGHLLGAAGGVEAVFCIKAIEDSTAPPTINYNEPDPECDLDYVPNISRELNLDYVMTNSLGFGGHNSTLIFKKI